MTITDPTDTVADGDPVERTIGDRIAVRKSQLDQIHLSVPQRPKYGGRGRQIRITRGDKWHKGHAGFTSRSLKRFRDW